MNFINKLKGYCFLLFVFYSLTAIAQDKPKEVIKSNEKINIDGSAYFIHKVEQGQTLYSICKVYNCTVEQLLTANPSLVEGLKAGMELRVPVLSKKENKKINLDVSGKFLIHKVEKKQTLYAISKMYNVSAEDITAANPDVAQGLKEGAEIKIPQKEIKMVEELQKEIVKELPKEVEIKSTGSFDINMFLPLYLKQNDSILNKDELVETDELYNKSVPGIEFYSGFRLACDSLIKTGMNIQINLYDVPADSAASYSFFEKKNFRPSQLWVGPFHSDAAQAAVLVARSTKVPVLIPFAQQNKLLLGNENVIKLTPSLTTEMEQLANYLFTVNKDSKFIVVNNGLSKEKTMVDALKRKGRELLISDSLSEVVYKNSGLKGVTNLLNKTKNNIIIVASNDQAFITDFINKIKGLDEKEFKVSLVGTESWINYDNLDINTIQKLNLQIPSNTYINYSDSITNIFIKKYRDSYQTEPGKYSFIGYDAAMYFIKLIQTDPTLNKLAVMKKNGLSTGFDFKKTAVESGYENQSLYLLKYENYELRSVK